MCSSYLLTGFISPSSPDPISCIQCSTSVWNGGNQPAGKIQQKMLQKDGGGPSKNRPQLARSLSPPLNGGKNACGQFTGANCQDSNHKGWGYCGNPSKFSHIGGMGISFSLAASLAPFAQLFEMLSWMWQSKSHRISHCFRHSVSFLQLRQPWIWKTRCVFGVFEGRRIILAESTMASPNSAGQDDETSRMWDPSTNWDQMISKFDKQLCPPRRPGRVHEAIESKWIKCHWCWQNTVLRGLSCWKMQNK